MGVGVWLGSEEDWGGMQSTASSGCIAPVKYFDREGVTGLPSGMRVGGGGGGGGAGGENTT